MTALYAIADEYQAILDHCEDGALDDATREQLNLIEHALTEKATNIAAYIRNTEELANSIKGAEAQMRKRRQTMEAKIRWMKEYLLENMEATGISKIECPWFDIRIRRNPKSVNVVNVIDIPDDTVTLTLQITRDEFFRISNYLDDASYVVSDIKVDKKELKARIEKGEKIDGAELTQSKRVQIS